MSALANGNPPYRLEYTETASGRRTGETVRRDRLRIDVRRYTEEIREGTIADMKVTDRHGEDVTVDWFG